MKTILLFVPDLMFSTRIEDAARSLGYQVASANASADFESVLAQKNPQFVVLTFDRTGNAWERLATAAHNAGVKVFAFGSHMNVAAFKRARELGCDEVVANSRMDSELLKLLQKWTE